MEQVPIPGAETCIPSLYLPLYEYPVSPWPVMHSVWQRDRQFWKSFPNKFNTTKENVYPIWMEFWLSTNPLEKISMANPAPFLSSTSTPCTLGGAYHSETITVSVIWAMYAWSHWIAALMCLSTPTGQSFSYLTLGITPGVTTQYLPRVDDGASSSIPILGGFPFGASSMANLYVGLNSWYWLRH